MSYQNIVIEADENEFKTILDRVCREQGLEYSVEYDGDLIKVFYMKRGVFFKRVQMEVARIIPLRPDNKKLQIVFWLSDLEKERSQKFFTTLRIALNKYIP